MFQLTVFYNDGAFIYQPMSLVQVLRAVTMMPYDSMKIRRVNGV